MSDTDLSERLREAAEARVGRRAVTSRFGIDCFALVDTLLRSLGAQTAHDGDVAVTRNADYDWGDGITLDSIRPGDIVQLRNHIVTTYRYQWVNGAWFEVEMREQRRPHHTAIIVEVRRDGSVAVVEQNVRPNPNRVSRNVIPRLAPGRVERRVGEEKIVIEVTGQVWAYRAVPKDQSASLRRSAGWRALAVAVPAEGGGRRPPGTIGMV